MSAVIFVLVAAPRQTLRVIQSTAKTLHESNKKSIDPIAGAMPTRATPEGSPQGPRPKKASAAEPDVRFHFCSKLAGRAELDLRQLPG
jgi:hypothetical protein